MRQANLRAQPNRLEEAAFIHWQRQQKHYPLRKAIGDYVVSGEQAHANERATLQRESRLRAAPMKFFDDTADILLKPLRPARNFAHKFVANLKQTLHR